jgi:arylsulfatase A-like enzyme
MDLMPTLLDLAGVPAADRPRGDGIALTPLLRDGGLEPRPLFWHYPHYSNQGGAPAAAIRAGDWKLIEWYEDGALELYNLKEDIRETRNLADAMPERVKELRARLDTWRKDVGAVMPRARQR